MVRRPGAALLATDGAGCRRRCQRQQHNFTGFASLKNAPAESWTDKTEINLFQGDGKNKIWSSGVSRLFRRGSPGGALTHEGGRRYVHMHTLTNTCQNNFI